jgi:hypothetical protein
MILKISKVQNQLKIWQKSRKCNKNILCGNGTLLSWFQVAAQHCVHEGYQDNTEIWGMCWQEQDGYRIIGPESPV